MSIPDLQDGYFTYSHRLKPGVTRDSHGLKVAQLAGMPDAAMDMARATLSSITRLKNGATERREQLCKMGHSLALRRT